MIKYLLFSFLSISGKMYLQAEQLDKILQEDYNGIIGLAFWEQKRKVSKRYGRA